MPSYPVDMAPVVSTENTVRFRITNVSMNTLIIAESPCSCGFFAAALAWACGVEPIPASLEIYARATPYRMACLTVIAAAPPTMADGFIAPT